MDGNAEISWHQLRMRMAVNASFAHGFRILRYTGTRKLLANIDKLHRVTRASAAPSQQHYKYQKRSGYQAFPNTKSHHPAAKFCHICSRTGNHNTQECWYNGRNDGFTYSGRNKGFTGRVR